MIPKLFLVFSIVLAIFLSSCKKDTSVPTSYPNFSQLKVGNYWIYERYNVDPFGNASTTGVFDSCYVEKDTLINNNSYYKVIRPQAFDSNFSYKFVRDSLDYLVNNQGQILFSSQNFTDTFYHDYITAATNTVCELIVKMADKDLSVNTPAGQFQTSSLKQSFKMYPNWSDNGNLRTIDTRYAENIGIVTETLPFYLSNPNYVQRRLVRYKLN